MDNNKNIFYVDQIFPDKSFLDHKYLSYKNMAQSCLFVLDTNILLSPYSVSEKSFEDIKAIYSKLKKENRLLIPLRALQEFAINRGNRIKDLFSKFEKLEKSSNPTANFDVGIVPLLQGNSNYNELQKASSKIAEGIKEYNALIPKVLESIQELYWDDPILSFYKEFISDEMIVSISEEEKIGIKENMENRYKYNIPPGFADLKKPDGGVGDLIIWQIILALGKNRDVVFVSNDKKKGDWYYLSSSDTPVSPRFELIYEFKKTNPQNSYDQITFPVFLSLQEAAQDTIDELALVDVRSQYEKISIPVFVKEIKEAYAYFRSLNNGFLGSKYFIETYLAKKGYDIRTSWGIYNELKDAGAISEYSHVDPNGIHLPLNAIEIVNL